jgi:hypothetical protein
MKWLKTYTLFERVSNETQLFESVEVSKTMIEDFLREFSDNYIRVNVELYIKPGETDVKKIFIGIGDEEDMGDDLGIGNYLKDILPLYENIDNLISMHNYLIGEGYNFDEVSCWGDFSKNNASQVNIVRMLSPQEQVKEFREFSEFLEDIEVSDKKSYKMVEFFYRKS